MYDPGESEVPDIADTLKKECAPFIKEMKKSNLHHWFFRAIEKHWNTISKPIKPRKNRFPSNTPDEIHEYMDQLLKKKFGWKPRSEGVFASSDRNQLEYIYGEPHLFFPIGNYKYVYNPKIRDIFMYFDEKYLISYENWGEEEREGMMEDLRNLLHGYTDKNLKAAYINIVEVSFKCKSYYLVNEKYGDMLKKHLEW